MKVLFDLVALQTSKNNFDGGVEYTKRILAELLDISMNYPRGIVGFCYNPNLPVDKEILDRISKSNFSIYKIERQKDITLILRKYDVEKFYTAMPYNYYNVDFGDVKVIFTLHGLRALELPTDLFERKYSTNFLEYIKAIMKLIFKRIYFSYLYKKYNRLIKIKNLFIITVSQHTKYSIKSYFPEVITSSIQVLYSPPKLNENLEIPDYPDDLGIIDGKYFMMISANRWTKNAYRALQAFAWIYDNVSDFDYKVIVLGTRNELFLKKFKSYRNIVFLPYVKAEYLNYLYKKAYAFIYPTLNEGFGYPPIEAMKYQTPVIASAISSVTEICGDAPLYFNPYSDKEMINRILQIAGNDTLYAERRKKGYENYLHIHKLQELHLKKFLKILLE